MNQANHTESILKLIGELFPTSLPTIRNNDLVNPHLFSPLSLQCPAGLLKQVKQFVSLVYKIKENDEYLTSIPEADLKETWPKTPSLLTCFDFHYSEEMGLKLIEVNTNASLYIPGLLQQRALTNEDISLPLQDLLQSFKAAFTLNAGDAIDIFDRDPAKEGLYFEFLIFQEWLEQNGFKVEIKSLSEINQSPNKNIYNRFTDFYLEEEGSQTLKEDYLQRKKVLSPNPRDYFLMADKKRLQVLKSFIDEMEPDLSSIIPESHLFSDFESKDELWSQRKKYFFKPSQSFGSKGVFSGKGISRKAFEKLYAPDFMAQELCPAGRREFDIDNEEVEMKYDLRFFTFEGRVQSFIARLYQGQATNMRTPWGGIAPIEFI